MVEQHRPSGHADLRRAIGATVRSARDAAHLRPVLLLVLAVAALHGASTDGFDRLSELNLLRNVDVPEAGARGVTPWLGLLRAVGLRISIAATMFVRRRLRDRSSDAAVRALLVTAVLFAVAMGLYALSTSLLAAVFAHWFVVAVRGVHTPPLHVVGQHRPAVRVAGDRQLARLAERRARAGRRRARPRLDRGGALGARRHRRGRRARRSRRRTRPPRAPRRTPFVTVPADGHRARAR